jgi:hypothetical protein
MKIGLIVASVRVSNRDGRIFERGGFCQNAKVDHWVYTFMLMARRGFCRASIALWSVWRSNGLDHIFLDHPPGGIGAAALIDA